MTDVTDTREGSDEPKRKEFSFEGSEVVITHHGDAEMLAIDGKRTGFYVTEKGYVLKDDAYRPPAKTLREAVERYLKSESER